MPLWDFRRESTQSVAGSNSVAGIVKGYQPSLIGGGDAAAQAEKRNVIVTAGGWIRRENRGSRTIEQILVAADPAVPNKNYASNNYAGNPDITQMYVKLNANGYISANATNVNLYVVFNTPVTFRASGNLCSITVANTSGGNNAVARLTAALANPSSLIINANNTLVFRLPKLQANNAGSQVPYATYKINSQTISVTGNPLYNPDKGTTVAANLVIGGATSNSLYDFFGQKITTFRVRLRG